LGYALSANVNGSSIEIGGLNGYLKRFDFGMNGGVGYQYEKIFVKLQYNQGLINLINAKGDIYLSMKNLNIAVTAGNFFN